MSAKPKSRRMISRTRTTQLALLDKQNAKQVQHDKTLVRHWKGALPVRSWWLSYTVLLKITRQWLVRCTLIKSDDEKFWFNLVALDAGVCQSTLTTSLSFRLLGLFEWKYALKTMLFFEISITSHSMIKWWNASTSASLSVWLKWQQCRCANTDQHISKRPCRPTYTDSFDGVNTHTCNVFAPLLELLTSNEMQTQKKRPSWLATNRSISGQNTCRQHKKGTG